MRSKHALALTICSIALLIALSAERAILVATHDHRLTAAARMEVML